MQSKATTVKQYLAELPPDRRAILEAIRKVFKANLDDDIEEGILYGMIGYYLPHRIYPPGYHCDPKLPLCYAGLAAQKNYLSMYLGCVYMGMHGDGPSEFSKWFQAAWKATGKKLDMGKACIRFKKLEDVPLEVVAEALRRVPVAKYIANYELAKQQMAKAKIARAAKRKPVKRKAAKKPARAARPGGRT